MNMLPERPRRRIPASVVAAQYDAERAAQDFLFQLWGETPPSGFLSLFTKAGNATKWHPSSDFEAMSRDAVTISQSHDVWDSVGMYAQPAATGRGKADDVIAIPGFWMDLDIADEVHAQTALPATVEEAMSIFKDFPFKPTIVVHSGHGLQVWFLFDKPWRFGSEEQRKKAQALSKAFQEAIQSVARAKGWELDNTADLARVLRLPGTMNNKADPVPVRILEEYTDYARRYTIEQIEAGLLKSQGVAEPALSMPTDHPTHVPGDGADLGLITEGCGFMRHCRDATTTLPEPEWYAAMSILGRCQDGARFAHEWSRHYPGYSAEETDRKLRQALEKGGPRTCEDIIEKFHPEACETCPSRDKVKSPVVLGRVRQPLPLKRAVASHRPFPVDYLGPVLGPAAKATSEANGVPLAIAAQSFLAAATLAVQGVADVETDGRRSPISNYFITVARSGERKSSTDAEALFQHYAFEKSLTDAYNEAIASYQLQVAAYGQAKNLALKNCGREATRENIEASLNLIGEEPKEPLAPNVIVTDPTPAGLMRHFQNSRPSLGIFSDEGGQFVGGYAMLKEHQIETAANLSKFWDGKPITKARGVDGTVRVADRRLTMHLMLQPQVASGFVGNGALLDQGILSRALIVYPESTIGTRKYKRRNLRRVPEMKAYHERILAILSVPLPTKEKNPKELAPRAIKPSAEAMDAYRQFYDETEYQMRDGGALAWIRGFANKSAEHAARLAAVLTLVDDLEAPEIALGKMQAGVELMRFYLHEALRIHGSFEHDPDLDLAERLLTWAQGQGEHVALVDIYQRGPNSIRSKGVAIRTAKILEDHGWFIPVPGGAFIDSKKRQKVWRVVRDDI
ncbi:YfjI family protein [Solidesulfovibrio sp. C21]|uniref:YfjI family protein n=1 Tax=Solidesulfovibrio sp. C21 TaxID=3398613 RepID=UPI0039FB9FF5